jgi:hypothetical protein
MLGDVSNPFINKDPRLLDYYSVFLLLLAMEVQARGGGSYSGGYGARYVIHSELL